MTTILSSLGYRQIQVVMNDDVHISTNEIFRLYDNTTVVLSRTDSSDFQEYQSWVDEGNTPEPAE